MLNSFPLQSPVDKLDRLIKMAFGPVFGRAIRATFDPRAAAAATVPWYLSGGIAAANCIAAYQPKGAADLAASYVNLANPGTYDCTTSAAPAFATESGWTFDGSGKFLDTGITHVNSWTYIIRCYGTAAGGGGFGRALSADGGTEVMIVPYTSGSEHVYKYDGGSQLNKSGSITTSKVMCMTDSTHAYLDGVSEGDPFGSSSIPTNTMCIGNRNSDKARGLAGVVAAVAVYNISLDATTVGTLSTAMAAL